MTEIKQIIQHDGKIFLVINGVLYTVENSDNLTLYTTADRFSCCPNIMNGTQPDTDDGAETIARAIIDGDIQNRNLWFIPDKYTADAARVLVENYKTRIKRYFIGRNARQRT